MRICLYDNHLETFTQLYEEIIQNDLKPDKQTYQLLLEACARTKLSTFALELLEEMFRRNVDITPL